MPAPNLAAVSVERWNQAEDKNGWLDWSPELVVEVASPSNRKPERKVGLYLQHGAEQVWLVYRDTKMVRVFTAKGTTDAGMNEAIEFRGTRVPFTSIFKRQAQPPVIFLSNSSH